MPFVASLCSRNKHSVHSEAPVFNRRALARPRPPSPKKSPRTMATTTPRRKRRKKTIARATMKRVSVMMMRTRWMTMKHPLQARLRPRELARQARVKVTGDQKL